MAGRQAKVLTPHNLRRMLAYAGRTATPDRDRVIILLSAKAGLRAAEIAKLTWPMILDTRSRVASQIEITDGIAKHGSGRRIPIHPDLRLALDTLRRQSCREGPVIRSARGGHMRPNSLVNWFVVMFADLGLQGCSSHSGRRTFITNAARAVHRVGGSLRDVQLLAGHSSIETTQRYIDGNSDAQRRLVSLI